MLPVAAPFSNATELKELPFVLDGSYDWLKKTPIAKEWAIGNDSAAKLPAQLKSAVGSAKKIGVSLPAEFATFMSSPKLHKHVRSTSACYLDVAESLLPFEAGYLLRFLNDQQGCAFWYLYMNADASDHCVVVSFEYFDADEMDYEMDELAETDFQYQAESFEAFICRFWLENEILFAKYESTPLPNVEEKFLRMYTDEI